MDFKVSDETEDMALENGDIVFVTKADAVKQSVRQRLKMFMGEWFLDLDSGVPYYQDVLVKNPNPTLIEGIFKNEILATPGILELLTFSLDYDNATRKLTIAFTARAYDEVINFFEILGGKN